MAGKARPVPDYSPLQICARALAILGLEAMPFNPTGWRMFNDEDLRRQVQLQQKEIARSFGASGMTDKMQKKVALNTKTLPDDFLIGLQILDARFREQLEGREIEIVPSHRLLTHSAAREMLLALEQGYDSEGATASSGSARGWAAWIAGEAELRTTVSQLRESLESDQSNTAKTQYIIALGRLDGANSERHLFTTLQKGSKSASKWTEKFPFWMGIEEGPAFGFSLSDRSAAAIALAYVPTESRLAKSINESLIRQFEELLNSPKENPFSGEPMRTWAGIEDSEFEQMGSQENHVAFLETLVFCLARRRVLAAWPLLASYFRSVGHHPTGHFETAAGQMIDPGSSVHSVRIELLLAALYHLAPLETVALWKEKVAEANAIFTAANQATDGYDNESSVWRWMYSDDKLYASAQAVFSRAHFSLATTDLKRVSHKTHSDFLR